MSFDIKLRDYQVEASEGADKNRENGKRFTGAVSPTGSGKSFIGMHEIDKLTKRSKDGKVLFIAPTNEIISQFQRHIMNVIDPEGKRNFTEMRSSNGSVEDEDIIKNNSTTRFIQDYFKSEFGLDIEFHCYKYIEGKSDEFIHNLMKNTKLCIFDEAHRAVAKEWEGRVKEMMKSAPNAQFLGITATPDRDADEKNAMERLAKACGDYTDEEIARGEHLASDIMIEEAIRDGYVNEPEVYRFDVALDETEEYKKLESTINRDGIDNELRDKLLIYKNNIDTAIGKVNLEEKDEAFAKFVRDNINPNAKKGIVFIPPFNNQETDYLFEDIDSVKKRERYIADYKNKIEKMFEGTGKKVNFSVVYSALNIDDSDEVRKFEETNTNPNEVNIIIAINKLNEGVHLSNIDFEISLRPIITNIMFSQQNGRVIHGIEPGTLAYNHEAQIFDRYNNFFNHRHLKEEEPRIEYDGRKMREVRKFIEKNGRLPESDSDDIIEARLALNLKRILSTDYNDKDRQNGYAKDKIEKYKRIKEEIEDTISTLDLKGVIIPDRTAKPSIEEILREGFYETTENEKNFLNNISSANELLKKQKIEKIKGLFGIIDIASKEILKAQNKETTPENINEVLWKLMPDYTMDSKDTLDTIMDRVGLKNKEEVLERIGKAFKEYRKENSIKSTFLKKGGLIESYPFAKILGELQKDFILGLETFDEYEVEALAKYRIMPSLNAENGNINFAKIGYYLENGSNPNFYITANHPNGFIIPREDINSMSDKFYGINTMTFTKYTADPTGKDPNYKGYDIDGINEEGYNKDNYNRKGFNKDGISKETGTRFNKRGFYEKEGKYINVITGGEYDVFGYDIDDKTPEGWDRKDHKLYSKTRRGYSVEGVEFDEEGKDQFNVEEYNKDNRRIYRRYDFRRINGKYYSNSTQKQYNDDGKDVEGFDSNNFKQVHGNYYNKDTGTIYDLQGRTYDSIKYAKKVAKLSKNQIERGFNENGINYYTGTRFDLNGKTINEESDSIVRIPFVDKKTGEIPAMNSQVLKRALINVKSIFQDIHDGKSADDLVFDYAVENHISPMEATYRIRSTLKVALDAEMNYIPESWRLYNKAREDDEIKEITKFIPDYNSIIIRNAKAHNEKLKNIERGNRKKREKKDESIPK